jgi:acetyltransferase
MISEREEILDVSKNYAFPIFTSPLEAATTLHVSLNYYESRQTRNSRGAEPVYPVDRNVINAIRERCRAEGRIPLTDDALAICEAIGLQPMKGKIIRAEESLDGIRCRYPVALKLLSRDASHKSDIGGVRINIRTKKELHAAMSEMRKAIENLDKRPAIDGFLIQEMAPEGIECFVGGRRDPLFGPIVMAGLGGIYIEIFKDTAIRLAPVTKLEAGSMLRELKIYPLLQGARGKERVDMDAFVDVICRVSYLMTTDSNISEMDLNPIIVHSAGQGVSLVDARIFF